MNTDIVTETFTNLLFNEVCKEDFFREDQTLEEQKLVVAQSGLAAGFSGAVYAMAALLGKRVVFYDPDSGEISEEAVQLYEELDLSTSTQVYEFKHPHRLETGFATNAYRNADGTMVVFLDVIVESPTGYPGICFFII